MGDFEVDTRLDAGPDGESGAYRAKLSEDWLIWGPSGGYLAAIALRAAGLEARVPRPASFSAHFLSVARFAEVDVQVDAVRRGRRSESLRVSISQKGKAILEALVRTAADSDGLSHDVGRVPEVPGPEGLTSSDDLRDPDSPRYPFWDNIESRPLQPQDWREPRKPRDPRLCEWFRFRPRATFDDAFVDAGRALLLVDTLSWPAAAQPHPDSRFQAPNLDVGVWFHQSAQESDWLLTDHECNVAAGGLMGTTGRVWSRDGRLLASGGAQLMCVPIPDP